MNATIQHDGSTRLAIRNLVLLDARAVQAAGRGLAAGLNHAVTVAQQKFLSGPRPSRLDVVTTRLRGSITSKVEVSGDRVLGRIGSNVPYAPVHEFGLVGHEPILVRKHERSRLVGDKLQRERRVAKGKNAGKLLSDLYRYDPKTGERVAYKRTLKQLAEKKNKLDQIVTKETKSDFYRRNFKYRGRPFLRPALEESKPVILAEIKRQLEKLNAES